MKKEHRVLHVRNEQVRRQLAQVLQTIAPACQEAPENSDGPRE